ncbi:putative leucine-rich repeat receptor-like serine/threonine-protein kinase-like [Capsicum annuum]|nr:putative leucine-rich repeat receptor-like serine/threonine-protein kinase-like [Capsicum annuum]
MVSLSFNIQLVVLVIALLFLQEQHSSAHALFGKLRKKEWLKFNSMQKDHDSVDGIIASVGGIRKMLVKQEHMVDDISVTGDATFDSMKTSQVDTEILKKNARNSLGVINFSEQNLERSKKEESKKFADAEDEVAKLMNKDYTGRNEPRRKPPINNHKPTD